MSFELRVGALLRAVLALTVAGLLAACAALPTRPTVGPIAELAPDIGPPSTTTLSPVYQTASQRRDVALRVWQVVQDHFYDPRFNQVDWQAQASRYLPLAQAARSDADLYAVLKGLAGSLRDSHTKVLTPRESLDRRGAIAPRLGIEVGWMDGRVIITAVEPESPAARVGVRAGDALLAAGNTRFDAGFFAATRAALRNVNQDQLSADQAAAPALANDGASDQGAIAAVLRTLVHQRSAGPVELQLSRDDHAPSWTVRLHAERIERRSDVQLRWLDDRIAVLRFNRFAVELIPKIRAALDQVTDARGLIIDLRGNPGGQLAAYRWFVAQFLPSERVVMRTLRRAEAALEQTQGEIRAGAPRKGALLVPLAILTDRRTASAAELTAVTLKEHRAAVVVGEPSCGCVVGIRTEFVLPDGGGLHVSETGFVSTGGMRMERQPTPVTVPVHMTLAQLRAGSDQVAQRARRALLDRSGD